jgi:hypothetical protein
MPKPLRRPVPFGPGASFDEVVIPDLDAAFRLARWLTRNEHDARCWAGRVAARSSLFPYFHGERWPGVVPANRAKHPLDLARRRVDALMDTFFEEECNARE